MSERSRLEERMPSIDCGSVVISYDESRLDRALDDLPDAKEENASYVPLAEAFFNSDIAPHITDASFGIDFDDEDDGYYPAGSISYLIARTYPRRRYREPSVILSRLQDHLESNIDFQGYDFVLQNGELSMEEGDRAFRIFAELDDTVPSGITLSVEDDLCAAHPHREDTLATATVWAQICDFVVRLGSGKHTAITPDQITRVTLGQIADYPSDIELSLVSEIEQRRRALGAQATLPKIDGGDISSDAVQFLSERGHLTLDELHSVTESIVNKKRKEYATLGLMTDINQADIVNALKTFLDKQSDIR
jgi:hypothetical protein